ncbi:hypothetical protein OE749_03060 [Aestuariibacter sp. AA17]|uniref:Uncharacterized protein n=1 Tax=Fluctibacter corallii TaxID=2984329 RepID=A0ABT3A4S0_9ALTE|nr:hypothetical protein [Aestuariibacter sp. AA17]MCV2883680.1 hypothetical protein [Aestuariibacter sp. AA17]
MANIGHVTYWQAENSTDLRAQWVHDEYGEGTGYAEMHGHQELPEKAPFEGEYTVTYYNQNKEILASRLLSIKKVEAHFRLEWRLDGKLTSVGIGNEINGQLVAGYIDIY